MDPIGKEYTNGEITVVWTPRLCDHSAICISELPKVFDNLKRPWIKMENAPNDDIIKVVDRCPTRALTWYKNEEKEKKDSIEVKPIIKNTTVRLMKTGPVLISGDFKLLDEEGKVVKTNDRISLCRCNKSKRMPFCDGSHREDH